MTAALLFPHQFLQESSFYRWRFSWDDDNPDRPGQSSYECPRTQLHFPWSVEAVSISCFGLTFSGTTQWSQPRDSHFLISFLCRFLSRSFWNAYAIFRKKKNNDKSLAAVTIYTIYIQVLWRQHNLLLVTQPARFRPSTAAAALPRVQWDQLDDTKRPKTGD